MLGDPVTVFSSLIPKRGGVFLKIVFPTCCGIDVHKTFLVATIITTPSDSLQPKYQKERFSTHNGPLNKLADWLLKNDCMDVCMESTGKYWVPVFNILEKRGLRVVIANPKWVKAVKGNKDDVKDSKWIAELFRIGLVKNSFIPNVKIRILREFTRYRYKLTCMKSSEKNRFQNAFTVCNVALDSVVSDMFGKSATAITDYLTSDEIFTAEHCVSLLRGSLKKKAAAVIESIEGYSITEEQKFRIGIVREHLHYIEELIGKMDDCITEMVEPYEGQIALLCTIPGIDRSLAVTVISEIGIDMTQFSSSKRLCCWAGLAPGSNQSAGKKKSVRISRAGVYLKPALVQAAHAAVKDKKNPYYAIKYERLSKRRGKKRAIIAIARMLLTAIYSMLSTGEAWNPVDLYKIDMPEPLKEKQRLKAIKQAIRFLELQGLKVS